MMGSGKSTIGKSVAQKLKLKFVDIDNEIELKEKISISKIFDKKGETYFRKVEQNICLEKLKKDNLLIALGGGSFVNPIVRQEVQRKTISFWLDVSINNLKKRKINFKKRPLISKKENNMKLLYKIYNERRSIYNLAKYRVNCNKLDKNSIINQICEIYEADISKNI